MSVEGYRTAVNVATNDTVYSIEVRQIAATLATAHILEAIHQRLMNLALKGDK